MRGFGLRAVRLERQLAGGRFRSVNIGEGARRKRPAVFRYHLEVALGSQAEVEVQVELARRLGLIDEKVHTAFNSGSAQSAGC